MAGVYVGFGAMLVLTVAGNLPAVAAANPGLHKALMGMYGFPAAILMVCVMGAELFTGNAAFCWMAAKEGRASLAQVRKRRDGGILSCSQAPIAMGLCLLAAADLIGSWPCACRAR